MSKPKVTTDTVKVSRLGCMRKSTVVRTDDDKTDEHVEVWVPTDVESAKPDIDAERTTNSEK